MARGAADHLARIHVVDADITTLDVDAVVNAANDHLLPGGGVCGAIFRAAGPELDRECRRLGGCVTGGAKISGGYGLRARHVIHAVGPVWRGGGADEDRLLASAYARSLELARDHGLAAIAFPAISTGIYGFPADRAARVAVAAVADFLKNNDMPERVVLCCFGPASARAHQDALQNLREG
ncbi:MAG: O-acetyl-ADP-ribose deacetylase [Alphaproteobacteria bacterium]|nr:O-acetyl-ADP-ribose deacetylase [Alphaproteobacteria bacterium]